MDNDKQHGDEKRAATETRDDVSGPLFLHFELSIHVNSWCLILDCFKLIRQSLTSGHLSLFFYGVGRGCGLGRGLGVGVTLGVAVGVGVAVDVAVGLGAGVGVGVGVTVGVGIGVGPDCAQYLPPVLVEVLE